MKIVVLDASTITQDDLNWDILKELGDLTDWVNTAHDEDSAAAHIGDADAALVSKVPITASLMDRCPNLKYIGVTATGYNNVDIQAAKERGIVVTNVPGYGTETVAEFAFSLLLHMTRKVAYMAETVERGDWLKSKEFCYFPCGQESLFGKTMGIVGFAAIGRKMAELAQAFGMKVVVHTNYPDREMESDRLRFVTFDELLKESDVVSLHCPLTEKRRHMMNEEAFSKMKKGAYFINTARGPLVDEKALAKALKEGWIKGAALDVLEVEPMREDCPLIGVPNCVIVPHVAWATYECRQKLIQIIYENLKAYSSGKPQNVVS